MVVILSKPSIYSWAILIIWYRAGIIDWTKSKLDDLDRKTGKSMSVDCVLFMLTDNAKNDQRHCQSKNECSKRT